MSTSRNACCCFDFTLPVEYTECNEVFRFDIDNIQDLLGPIVKKGNFQKEKGENTGYLHYQGRLSLKNKTRLQSLIRKKFFDGKIHWSLTNSLAINNYEYVTKDYTRVDGPWPIVKPTVTIQMSNFTPDTPWMREIIKQSEIFDLRSIDLIYDKIGGGGKSLLCEWMEKEGLAEESPPFRLMDDLVAYVCSRVKNGACAKCILFDMPRALKKSGLSDFYSGIEMIKNGMLVDKRYHATKYRISRPRIFIFTNHLPNFTYMTQDRWNIWTLKGNGRYDINLSNNCRGTGTDQMSEATENVMIFNPRSRPRILTPESNEEPGPPSVVGSQRVRGQVPSVFPPTSEPTEDADIGALISSVSQIDQDLAEAEGER